MKHSAPAIVTALAVVALLFGLCLEPNACMRALTDGITVWATKVLPATFPYFVLTALLSRTGAVGAVGRLFAPLTRRLYRTSGASGYACAVAFVSGYPVGARVLRDLVASGELARTEAERVTAFSSVSGPMFILGTVSSLLGSVRLAWIVLGAHLSGALLNGLLWRGLGSRRARPVRAKSTAGAPALACAGPARVGGANVVAMRADTPVLPPFDAAALPLPAVRPSPAAEPAESRKKPPANGDPVSDGVLAVLLVGGYIALFFVLAEFLRMTGLLRPLEAAAEQLCGRLSLPAGFGTALVEGLLEVTRGCVAIGVFADAAPSACVVATTALVSAGGVCILFQSMHELSACGVRTGVYALEKCTQAVLSALLAALLCRVCL